MSDFLGASDTSFLSVEPQLPQQFDAGQTIAPIAPVEEQGPTGSEIIAQIEDKITRDNMTYDQAQAFRKGGAGFVWNASDFQDMDGRTKADIMKRWNTKLPTQMRAQYENLDATNPENRQKIQFYSDYNAIRDGEGETVSSGWTGFGSAFTDMSVVGGIGFGVADLFSRQDLAETFYGDDVKTMEKIMVETAQSYNHELAQDYKIGKIAGAVTGIISDIGGTMALGATPMGAGLAATAEKVALAAKLKVGAGTLGNLTFKVVRHGLPAGIELVGEETLRSLVTGQMDTSQELLEYGQRIPGTFAMGMAFGLIGEAAIGIFKKAKKTFVDANIKAVSKGKYTPPNRSVTGEAQEDMANFIEMCTTERTPEQFKAFHNSLIAKGYSESGAKKIVSTARQSQVWTKPMLLKNDEVMQDAIMRTGYGAEFTREGTDMIFTKFNDVPVDKVRIKNEVEFYDFVKENMTAQYRTISEDLFTRIAPGAPVLKATTTTRGAKTIQELSVNQLEKSLSIGNTDIQTMQTLTDTMFSGRKKIIVEGVEGLGVPVTDPNTYKIFLPTKTSTAAQSKTAMVSYFNQLSEQAKKFGDDIAFDTKSLERYFGAQTNIAYNKTLLKKVFKTDITVQAGEGGFYATMKTADGAVTPISKAFPTEDAAIKAAGQQVHLESLGGPTGVIQDLTERGHKVTPLGDDVYNLKLGKEDFGEMTMQQIMDNPMFQPKLPYVSRPKTIQVQKLSPAIVEELDAAEFGVMGYSKQLREFQTKPSGYVKLTDKGDFEVYTAWNGVQLVNPTTGFTKNFETGAEAAKYLDNQDAVWKNLWNRSADSGWSISYTRGGYVLSNGVEEHALSSRKAVENFLGRVSQQASDILDEAGQDISLGIKRQLDETIQARRVETAEWRQARDATLGVTNTFERIYAPITNLVHKSRNAVADRIDRAVGHAMNLAHSNYAVDAKFINKLSTQFTDWEGEYLRNILSKEVDPSDWRKVAVDVAKDLGKPDFVLSPKHEIALDQIRKYFDYNASKFNVPAWKVINNYAPAMHKHADIAYGEWKDALSVQRALSDYVDIPNQQMPFFMNMRNDEIKDLAAGTNIFDIMKVYSRAGNRATYLEPVRKEFMELTDITGGKIPQIDTRTGDNIATKMRDAFGGSDPQAIKTQIDRINKRHRKLDDIEAGIGKWAKIKDNPDARATEMRKALLAETPESIVSASMSSSLMGLNLRLPVRNWFQIQTHTAPVIGIKYTELAMLDMTFNKTLRRELHSELIDAGIIKKVIPNQTTTVGGKFKEFSRYTQLLYKASDDMNRLTTAHAAGMRFDEAVKVMQESGDATSLLKNIRSQFLDEGSIEGIMQEVSKGNLLSAKNIYRDRVVSLTQFDYNQANNPKLLRGMGKVFGAYGSYPMQTFQLWKKGVTSGSAADKARFIATGVAMTGAVGVMMNDVLNVGGVPYDPTGNMLFMGGPYMDIAPSIQRGIASTIKPEGTLSDRFDGLWAGTKSIIPIGNFIDRGVDAAGMYQDGEVYEGFIRFMGGRADAQRRGFSGSYIDHFLDDNGDGIDAVNDIAQIYK